jgi:uncharacterized membrane protein YgcG
LPSFDAFRRSCTAHFTPDRTRSPLAHLWLSRAYNKCMFDRQFRRFFLLSGLVALLSSSLLLPAQDASTQHMRKYKTPPLSSHIEVTVVKDFNGKPIVDAHVIFHPIQGDKDEGYLEVKTNEDGKAIIDVLPIGDTVRMQIIASGYQTYGQDYKVDKDEMSMEIRMKRPGSQYSIYKDKSTTPKSSDGAGSGNGSGNSGSGGSGSAGSGNSKPANPPETSAPPPSDNKSSGSANPPNPQ